jgi:hypothetical protein
MIKVTVTENSAFLDELEFDDDNIIHHEGGVAIVSRDAMKFARGRNLWGRIAHAAFWVSDTDLAALLEQSQHPIDLVLQRLQTGWQPTRADIQALDIPQFTLRNWSFAVDALEHTDLDYLDLQHGSDEFIIGKDAEGRTEIGEVIWIDAGLRWALCQHALFWLD